MLRKPFPFFLVLIFILALSTFSMALAVDQAPGDSEQSDSFQIQSPASFWPGQDGFGYLGSTPTYAWIEISRGTTVYLSDDDYAGPFDIGFGFEFYGNGYKQFYINSNGYLSFGAGATTLSNTCPLPDITLPDNIIALMWDVGVWPAVVR